MMNTFHVSLTDIMKEYTFLIFLVIKFPVHGDYDFMSRAKLVRAQVNTSFWKNLLAKEQDKNGLDLFARRNVGNDNFELTFQAFQKTIDLLTSYKIKFKNIHKDVMAKSRPIDTGEDYSERRSGLHLNKITFNGYLSYEEILQYLNSIKKLSSKHRKITVEAIGKTIENRDIVLVKIEHPGKRNIMFFDAGIHAREWLAIMTGMYLLNELVQADKDSTINQMNWYIIPCLNPDGFVYSYQTNRLHRKNMNKKHCSSTCRQCGVDLNRNFGYMYGVASSSGSPCSQFYKGEKAFSEPESRILRDVLQKHAHNIKLYLSLHSYGNYFLHPWGYAKKSCNDCSELKEAAGVAVEAIRGASKHGTKYQVAGSAEAFGEAAGGSDDYAKSLGIKYSYTMEVQEGRTNGFDPPESKIRDYAAENFAGLKVLADYINDPKRHNMYKRKTVHSFVVTMTPNTLYITLYTLIYANEIN